MQESQRACTIDERRMQIVAGFVTIFIKRSREMRIAICDDEKEIRELLAEKTAKLCPKADISLWQSGAELLAAKNKPDILLLDIQMQGKDGMETARELRGRDKTVIIIFVTALEDYVFQAFDVGAFHYLVKPFDDRKFAEVLQNALRQLADRERLPDSGSRKDAPDLVITAGGMHITVNISDIVYAEVFDRKIILHTMDEDIEYYGKMKELEKKAGEDFYRTHRSFLVNFGFVRKYDAATVWLKKGQALIAKQNYHGFVKAYLRYNQRKGRT